MVTTLYLIRHGETEGAEVRRYKGSIDVPLSEEGIRQMERLAKYLGENSSNPPSPPFSKGEMGGLLNAVYCSDLSRAIKSAEIIAEPYRLKPIIMPELRERNFGIWEGMSFDEIREKYPQEFDAWAKNPLKYSPMEGESTIEVRNRTIDTLNKILSKHMKSNTDALSDSTRREHRTQNTDKNSLGSGLCDLCSKNIAIVSHGGVNRVILCHVLGISLENIFRIEQDYAAVNIIEFWDRYPVVKLINGVING